jgi:hypothetical protein
MKTIITTMLCLMAFIIVLALAGFIVWCGGFDFNQRNANVGLGVFIALVCAVGAAGVTAATRQQ